MKLMRNPKVVENLQALIDSFETQPILPPEVKDVHKLYRYKKCTGREMIDHVILDLGSDANVLPKQTWK